ncbi:MAG: NADH-quinone oxidoreductase subunit G [Nocardioides sp.]
MTSTPTKVAAEVTLTIDGQSVTVPEGTLVIRAAEKVGVEIPRFCDHPLLAPVGACRQCLVDIPDAGNGRGFPKPQASCTIPVAAGMVVHTANPTAVKAQQGVMEFLLVNHPLDCPVCDKGGECPLQNQAMAHGRAESRFAATPTTEFGGIKRTFPKPINVSANILLDRERCVSCARCTRFAAEIAGDPDLVLIDRGSQQQVGIADGKPFNSYFSGNVIQICPVGALTSAEYRFRSRPFDLISVPGVAEHDACGAAIRIDHRRGTVLRRLSGNDPEVNQEWITDKDRFAFRYADGPDRIDYPRIRETDADGASVLRPASWLEAFAVAAAGLRSAGGVGVLPGGRLTAEDAYGYAKFARVALGTNDIDFRSRPLSAEETAFLTSRVALSSLTYAEITSAPVVVLAGLEPEDEAGTLFLRLRSAVRAGRTKVVTLAPFTSAGSAKLDASVILTVPGAEAAALKELDLPDGSVVLLGERLALSKGALSVASKLAGVRTCWVPRRAGDRGAVEAGALPTLLPGGRPAADPSARVDVAAAWGVARLPETPGRTADEIVAALGSGDLGGLLVAGVEINDSADPAAFRAALSAATFVVACEVRDTEITAAADVVFPVAPTAEKAGSFVNLEGRVRPFDAVFTRPGSLPDLRVLAGIAEEMGTPLGFRDVAGARAEMIDLGPWDGKAAPMTTTRASAAKAGTGQFVLATWKQLLDNGSLQRGDKYLDATARPAVLKVAAGVLEQFGEVITVTGDRGSWTLPAQAADLADGVVWLPANSHGNGVLADLASPGSRVTLSSGAREEAVQ